MTEPDPWRVLTATQAEVARRFLAARAAERRHLVIYLSGAHAYGFPSRPRRSPPGAPGSSRRSRRIDAAAPTAILPPDPAPEAIAAVDDWLRRVRQQFW